MAGRKVQSREEVTTLLADADANGVDHAEWARRQGVDGRSLRAWCINIGLEWRGEAPAATELVELVATSPVAAVAPIVIHCGRFAVEVGGDVEDALLRRVLAAVAAC